MFFSKNLQDIDHCFFSKLGGNSKGIYKGLNCGNGSKDNSYFIRKNHDLVSKYYCLSKKKLVTLHQTHSSRVLTLNSVNKKKRYEYDGVVTNKKNIILGILTADCAPILFYDPIEKVIGACHAGWKGSFDNIIENTISSMISLGSKAKYLKCAIGPCIGQDSYIVGFEFYARFLEKNLLNKKYFIQEKSTKYKFNLHGFIANKVQNLGICDISSINLDTYANEELCFSYRRSIHKKENDYGRMISTIVIKE